jgi:hypothetical protein
MLAVKIAVTIVAALRLVYHPAAFTDVAGMFLNVASPIATWIGSFDDNVCRSGTISLAWLSSMKPFTLPTDFHTIVFRVEGNAAVAFFDAADGRAFLSDIDRLG